MSQQAMNVGPYILEHKTVAHTNPRALDLEINELLKAGWLLRAPMTAVDDQFVVTMILIDARMHRLLNETLAMTIQQLDMLK
jgi:hypothetical protein